MSDTETTHQGDAMSDFTPTASITIDADDCLVVRTFFGSAGVDRPEAIAYGLGKRTDRRHDLAWRLVWAIEAGVVFTNPTVKTDVNDRTYVAVESQVIGRRLNADLKRLGF
jgi:hypothetical protein